MVAAAPAATAATVRPAASVQTVWCSTRSSIRRISSVAPGPLIAAAYVAAVSHSPLASAGTGNQDRTSSSRRAPASPVRPCSARQSAP